MKFPAFPKPWMVGSGYATDNPPLNDVERLTAGWIALGVILVAARFSVLHLAESLLNNGDRITAWLPLAIYQDLCFLIVLACITELALRATRRPVVRGLIRTTAWVTCLTAAWYAVVSVEIFRFLSTPLTFRLIAMSDNLRGIHNSMESALTQSRLVAVLSAPLAVVALAVVTTRFASPWVKRVRRCSSQPIWRITIAVYLAAACAILRIAEIDSTALANPHAAMLFSFCDREDPFELGNAHESDLADFRPARLPEQPATSPFHGLTSNCNVLLVVLESVGAQALSHYGAEYDCSPELTRLAEFGVTFDRLYASQPYTSNAMAGIFCSIYPWHGWRSLPRRAPDLRVRGLGQVLQETGYRTALLHTGDMQFDNEKDFLLQHGFSAVHDVWTLKTLLSDPDNAAETVEAKSESQRHLPDALLLPAALRWIDADRTRPFFLTLWTIQTHHPYYADSSLNSPDSGDPEQDRYFNAVRVADRLLGDVVRGLEVRNLAENTLVVVVGDHGELFSRRGHRGHSKTVSEGELRVPLVLISPRLKQQPRRHDVLGQQIDIAPTLLELLGLTAPLEWQGRSLFAAERTNRVYFFTAFHHYLFGVIENHQKYVFNASTGKSQMFDLVHDPDERRDLRGVSVTDFDASELHRRLASWVQFQNQYLTQFLSDSAQPRRASTTRAALGN